MTKRPCRIDDVIQAHARAAGKDRSVQPPESMVIRELRCARGKAAVASAVRRGVLRRGLRGLYVPAGVDPGAEYIFRRGTRGQLAGDDAFTRVRALQRLNKKLRKTYLRRDSQEYKQRDAVQYANDCTFVNPRPDRDANQWAERWLQRYEAYLKR